MAYYYVSDTDDSDYENLPKLKKKLKKIVKKEHLEKLQSWFGDYIKLAFSSKNTFGWVFTDYDKDKGRLIGKGEKFLFELIGEQYDYLVLFREHIEDPYVEEKEFDGKKILCLNIKNFRDIMQIGDTKKLVKLFLDQSVLDDEKIKEFIDRLERAGKLEEQITLERVLNFINKYPEEKIDDLQKVVNSISEMAKKFKVKPEKLPEILNKIEELPSEIKIDSETFSKITDLLEHTPEEIISTTTNTKKIIELVSRFSKQYKIEEPEDFEKLTDSFINIFEGYDIKQPTNLEKIFEIPKTLFDTKISYFEKILAEFDEKIHSDIKETELRDFVFKHIWLLDFKYLYYQNKAKEKELDVGDIDIYLYKNRLGLDEVHILEFKRANAELTTDKYRGENKPVILAEVGKALSQTTYYLENQKKPGTVLHGIVIIGRRKDMKDYFIDQFNQYLHGLEIVTFDELYEKAKNTLKAFKEDINPEKT